MESKEKGHRIETILFCQKNKATRRKGGLLASSSHKEGHVRKVTAETILILPSHWYSNGHYIEEKFTV
jgi:hypothetical protein